MQFERKALYNLLRMHWLRDPLIKTESWQVEDYRLLSEGKLLARLEAVGVCLNREGFCAHAQQYDTPEELSDSLTEESWEVKQQDKVYLIIFELWRRLMPEKLCLSLFCDELDYQINQYDQNNTEDNTEGNIENDEEIQDVLENMRTLLEQNADEGKDPTEVFTQIAEACANDLESFLYDFISERIDQKNISYAAELLEGFRRYVKDIKWFDFLRARLIGLYNLESSNDAIRKIVENNSQQLNLELCLEMLAFMVQGGERTLFSNIVQITLPLVETEEDFEDLLQTCIDYYAFLDQEQEECEIQKILDERIERSADLTTSLATSLATNTPDPDFHRLLDVLSGSNITR